MDHTRWHRSYIRSRAWAKRRTRYFAQHPEPCTAYGLERVQQVHHLTYVIAHHAPGNEPDWQLKALCADSITPYMP